MFSENPMLEYVDLSGVDSSTINKLITLLPDRTDTSKGELLLIQIANLEQIDETLLNDKHWSISKQSFGNNVYPGIGKSFINPIDSVYKLIIGGSEISL